MRRARDGYSDLSNQKKSRSEKPETCSRGQCHKFICCLGRCTGRSCRAHTWTASRSQPPPSSELNHGLLELYSSPGTCIGTGIEPANIAMPGLTFEVLRPASSEPKWDVGTRTPHSQLRQLSFGCLEVLSLTRRPLLIHCELAGCALQGILIPNGF